MMSLPIQTKHTSFDATTTIHPWDSLICGLVQDVDESDFERFLHHSQQRIKSDYNRVCLLSGESKKYEYFNAVVKNLGEDGAVDFLEHLMAHTLFHGEQGAVSYQEQFRKYREEKILFQRANGLTFDQSFVGRWEVQNQILQHFHESTYKGIVICGMPGMGKTSVARQICFRLTNGYKNWRIINVNQQGRTEFEELFGDLVWKIMAELRLEEVPSVGMSLCDLKRHLQALLAALADQNYNYLILLDDLDAYCSSPEQLNTLQQILKHDILYNIANFNNIKFLLTTSTKLSRSADTLTSGGCKVLFDGQMIEYELKPLTSTEIQTIFEKSASVDKATLKEELCQKICEALDGNAMAISTVAGLLRSYPLDKLVDGLQRSSSVMQSHTTNFLQKSFESQNESLQFLMSRLTVFETGQFDVSTAVAVDSGMRVHKHIKKELVNDMGHQLIWLASNHLIENEKVFISGKKKGDTDSWYLHSLVFGFLSEKCSNSERLKEKREEAKNNFVRHFCAEVVKIGEKNDMPACSLKKTLDWYMVHIKKFFAIVCDDGMSLLEIMPQKRDSTKYAAKIVQLKKIWTIAEYCLTSTHQSRFVKQQAECAKNLKNLYLYIYWRSLEAKCLLAVDRTQLAEMAIDELFRDFRIGNDLPFRFAVNGWEVKVAEQLPAVGQLFLMKGRIYFCIGRKERNNSKLKMAMAFLENALQIYTLGDEQTKKVKAFPRNFFKKDIAIVENLKGCVYFKLGDLMKAKECHERAITVETDLKPFERLDPNFTDYRSNVAATYHQIGLDTKIEEERQKYLKQALETYNRCIEINKNTQNVMSPTHASILQNRAEIYYVQGEYERAIKDGKEVLRISQALYVHPPHTDLTSAMERVAHYCFKLGKKTREQDEEKGRLLLQEAWDMYNDVLEHIRMGGLPFQHTDDQQLYRDLLQQIQLGQIPLKPGSERPTYERILNDIQRGTKPSFTEGEKGAYNHVAELIKERKFEQSGNRTYRHTKENHEKVMELLFYSSKEIRAKMREYEEYERGVCDKDIARNTRSVIQFDTQEFIRKALAAGAQFIPDPIQDDDSDTESSSSDSSSSSSSGSGSGGRDSPMMDIHLELVEARKRRDSGMSEGDFDEGLGDVDMDQQDGVRTQVENVQKMDVASDRGHKYEYQGTQAVPSVMDSHIKSENTEIDNVFQPENQAPAKKRPALVPRLSSKMLIRQLSIDEDGFVGSLKQPTEQSGVSLEGNNSSVEMRLSKEPNTGTSAQYTNRDSGVGVTSFGSYGTGSGRTLSAEDSRKSWRSSAISLGSQESESFDISNMTCDEAFLSGSQTTQGLRGKEGWKRKSSSSIDVQSRQQLWSSAGSQDSVTAKVDGLVMEDKTEISPILEEPAKKVPKTEIDTDLMTKI